MNLFIGIESFMLTNEDRKQILISVLETIRDISDTEYQKRIWILGEGPEEDSFDDVVNYFFDEVDGILESHKDFSITVSQYRVLKKFRDQFEEFSDNNDFPEQFIDTPEWERIIKMAKEVLGAFNYQKESD
jgi:hypothetical protein